jgi:Domain of unknown function (DUF4845)
MGTAMNKQRGVTITGLLMTIVVLMMVSLLGFKVFGPYKQYFTIQKVFKQIAVNPEVKGGGRKDFLQAWSKYAMTDDIGVLSGDDVELTKDGNDIVISAAYSVRVPLFKNISLLIDFAPSSAAK